MSDAKGYNSSFLNFVEQNPMEAELNNEDKNSEESSENTEDLSKKKEISPQKPAKRGRLMGPKSVRKRYESSEKSGSHSESDEDDEPPAIARRVRAVRAAKVKAIQLTRGINKKRKAAKCNDVESSSSDAGEKDDDVEYDGDNLSSDASRGSKYDSEEDPAWRSKKGKSSSVKKLGNRSKRVRQRTNPAGSSKTSSRRSTDSGQVTVSSSPATSKKPGVQVMPTNDKAGPSSTPITLVTPAAAQLSAATTHLSAVATQPKEPCRPAPIASVPTLESYVLDLDPPHHCQKGDFLLDRRDNANYDSFPVWRIDSQRLLQKFEPFEKDGKLLHRALCTYSSWPVAAQQNYTAISVRYISCTRGKEIVDVHDKYRPRPVGVRGEELDALREAFTIYTQILLSQALEPTFIAALYEEPDDYYTVPFESVRATVKGRRNTVEAICKWKGPFLETLKKFHAFTLTDYPDGKTRSEASVQSGEVAKKRVRFYGHVYDHTTLESFEQVAEPNGLVDELKQSTPNLEDHDILDTCLRDQPWMQQMFSRLSNILENADRVSGR